MFPDAQVLDGLAIRGNDAQNRQDEVRKTVEDWIKNWDIGITEWKTIQFFTVRLKRYGRPARTCSGT